MTDRELMQQALEALENNLQVMKDDWEQIDNEWGPFPGGLQAAIDGALTGYEYFKDTISTITALRERLAQPQMQPCAGRNCGSTNPNLHSAECFGDYEKATGMVAQQPGIEELEHENRLMRARNERLKAEVDRLERENFAWRTKLGVRGYEMQIEDLRAKLQGLLHYRSKP